MKIYDAETGAIRGVPPRIMGAVVPDGWPIHSGDYDIGS